MAFLGVYRAIYDYVPQSEGELTLTEGDLLFVLDNNSDDDWWKAKKKAMSDDEDEPEGLIPNNYIEQAQPLYQAKALYDYTKQTDEELSFPEEARLDVYDTSDDDWTLVGLNGEYGFAPAIYIEKASAGATSSAAPAAPAMPARPQIAEPEPEEAEWNESPPESPVQNPAAALAGIIAQKTGQSQTQARSYQAPMDRGLASPPLPSRPQYTPDESEDEPAPSMPPRPIFNISREPVASPMFSPVEREPQGVSTSLPYNRAMAIDDEEAALRSPGGFRLYNISEVVSHMGKNKKMPITLGINLAKGLVSLSPAKARDGPSQEWSADRLSNYSIEGKHVFLDLVRPSKSVDLHAGAKDTAQEIIGILSELAGASKAEGLREVWAASSGTGAGGKKKGTMLYDFMAQGDDEVTVAIGDEVVILDDTKSEEWWMVKRLKNGKEGVVPSSYVEITGTLPEPSSAYTGLNAARSTVEQNRLEEQRLTREVARSSTIRDSDDGSRPERHSSLAKEDHRKSRHSKSDKSDKPKPNAAKVRTWTDRSGSFKVEAEFIGLKDGKIHLHKQNGVKIAVPVNKMAIEDLEYVERATGVSLDEDKPLSEIKRRSTEKRKERPDRLQQSGATAGAVIEQKPDYDWFDFFLGAGVNPQICERYAAAFSRDQMGEEILPDVDTQLLRTLGLKEGDILRVMKYLDNKFGRTGSKKNVSFGEDDADGAANGEGGLFSGPGGALRNNTRKGRPAPAVQTNDVVDADAFKQKDETSKVETPLASAPARPTATGFDDDAWDVKPSKTAPAAEAPAPAPAPAKAPSPPPAPAAPEPPKLTQNMSDLSLLSPALQPAPAPQAAPQAPPAPPQQPARTGADPSFFDKLAAPSPLQSQVTGMRQRPAAPAQMQTGNSMIAPPPQRAASAPGLPQQGFAPPALQPQMTGYQAPPGQSLQSSQQQQQFQQQQMTGFPQQPGYQGLMPQATGFMQPQQGGFPAQYQMPQPTGYGQQQPFVNGQATGSPFADPTPRPVFQSQPTGMTQSYTMQPQQTGFGMPPPMQPQQTGLPPALQPQRTGFTPQSQFGQNYAQQQQNGFGNYGQQAPPMPPMPAQPTGLQPLVPQKTGPPPPVRFGVQPAARLTPQPTGRANLSKATPQNPFGF